MDVKMEPSRTTDRGGWLMMPLRANVPDLGSGVKDLVLSEDGNKVIIQFAQGERVVNAECDSGYAMITDVMKAL